MECKEQECLFVANYGVSSRRVHKFKGGWLEELCDGQMWSEANLDEGPAAFWFGTLFENKKHIITWDATRDIWVMIKV